MDPVRAAMIRYEGMARASELDRNGVDRDRRDIGVMYGSLIRVRKGWFADPDLPEVVRVAWRVGGRVACLSALALLGEADAAHDGFLHIELPRNASRLRNPPAGVEVVRHWTRRPLCPGRFVVPLDVARQQASRCAHRLSTARGARVPAE